MPLSYTKAIVVAIVIHTANADLLTVFHPPYKTQPSGLGAFCGPALALHRRPQNRN